ncbi:MAG: fatty acid desaturase [Armatimonadetes bacterium]|nr:fatty acid desaturase [Armatimonadota bacterium]
MASPNSPQPATWSKIVAPYQKPDSRLAVGQLLNTVPVYILAWYLAYRSLEVSYLLTLGWCLLAAGMVVRIFIFQHDCGHGSFLPSKTLNNWVGFGCSLVTATPYFAWRHDHAVHHATAGDLDHRGTGDIKTLTVAEYLARSPRQQLLYRLYRHPFILFVIGPVVHFALLQRFTGDLPDNAVRERRSIYLTNACLVVLYTALGLAVGLKALLLVQLPIMALAASAGVWLFYVQHQFDEAYWVHQPDWDYTEVALQGSSYYKLPRLLQWFTGNIGFHHVHHLSPRIPNYRLEQCHRENAMFHQAKVMDLRDSLQTIPLALYDEEERRLISFRELRSRREPLGLAA